MRTVWRVAALTAALAMAASGYYHFVHYLGRTGPFTPAPEKFDVNLLPNKTLFVYVSDQGPTQYTATDSFTSVISQLRAAAKVWNDVEASDLRVEYAGLFSPGTPQSAPGVQVVFEDLPPGVYGYGGPTVKSDIVPNATGGLFVPISQSVVVLSRDLSRRPSYGEGFFLTAVHELGHALGLQHSLASGVMSTEYTRGVTRAIPLAADDIAGLTQLYPNRAYPQNTGSVAGRVTLAGEGVNMASVVAISPSGPAISSLTNPDGTYRIDGIPAGMYFVYVHPLPPPLPGYVTPADIRLPMDTSGRAFDPGPNFDTVFFPGTREPFQAVSVAAGQSTDNLNFSVQRRNTPAIHTVQTYSFPAQVAVKPAMLNKSAGRWMVVAAGTGLVSNSTPVAGLNVSVLGGAVTLAPGGLRPYASAPASYIQMDFQLNLFAPDGPGHLVFSANNDIYVLPNAFRMVQRQPPAIGSVAAGFDPQGNRAAVVSGTNLGPDTRILFDGVAATVRSVDEAGGRLFVSPPPAPLNHRASVIALNPDGQSSLFLNATPPTYIYEAGDPQSIAQGLVSINPSSLPAGTDSMVEVTGFGTNFVDGMTTIGFGSTDVSLRRIWVMSPTRILANVSVSPQAAGMASTLTVTSGLHYSMQPFGFQVLPPNPRQITVNLPILNVATGQRNLSAGGTATLTTSNLPANASPASVQITVADRPAPVVSLLGGLVTFQVPNGLPAGPAILRIQAGADSSLPVLVNIDTPAAQVASVLANLVSPVEASRPARAGDILTVLLTGVNESTTSSSRVTVLVNGVEHLPLQMSPSGSVLQLQFVLSPQVPSGSWPMIVVIDGRQSQPYILPVR